MNKVILIGRLTKDPELRYAPGSGAAVTTFTLATNKFNSKTGQKEADFVPIVVWGKRAESIAKYMRKGSEMALSGRIQTRSYDAKDGTKRYVTEVVADPNDVEFLGSKNNSSGSNLNNNNEYSQPINDGFEGEINPVDDGDMPF